MVGATAVLCDPPLLGSLLRLAGPSRFAVAIEVRKEKPVLRGVATQLQETAPQLADRAREAGVSTILYRDLDRDGQLSGLDVRGAAKLLSPGSTVLVAGGGATLDDIQDARNAGLHGVVLGRAFYDGRFSLSEAIACSE